MTRNSRKIAQTKTVHSDVLAIPEAEQQIIGQPHTSVVPLESQRQIGWTTGVTLHQEFDTLDPEIALAFGA